MSHHPSAGEAYDKAQDWAEHKDAIRKLYITEGRSLNGADGVMELMKTRRGFVKSKSQFTTQLRKWGFRKDAKETDASRWKTASYKVAKAKNSGKEVQLFHKGVQITEKVLRTQGYLTSIDQCSFEGYEYKLLQGPDAPYQLQFIAYLLSNNLYTFCKPRTRCRYLSDPKLKLLGLLKAVDSPRLLSVAPLSHLPSSKALLERIFGLAVEVGDLPTVRRLLENGMSPNGHRCHTYKLPPREHVTPLQIALFTGNLPMATLLMSYSAKIDHPGNRWKSSAIVVAIIGWYISPRSRVRDIEENDSSSNDGDADRITLFVHSMIAQGAKTNIEELDVHPDDKPDHFDAYADGFPCLMRNWYTPLIIASRYGLTELVDFLIGQDEPSKSELASSLNEALHDCLVWCMDITGGNHRGMNTNEDDTFEDIPRFPLFIVSRLLEAGADVNEYVSYRNLDPYSHEKELEDYDEDSDTITITMYILELVAYTATWTSNATNNLLRNGAFISRKALENSLVKNNFEFFRLYSMIYLDGHDDYLNLLADMFKQFDLRHMRWLQHILDEYDRFEILELAIGVCKPNVWISLLNTSERALQFICRDVNSGNVVALSALPPGTLKTKFGNDLEGLRHDPQMLGTLLHKSIIYENTSLAKFLVSTNVPINQVVEYEGRQDTALCAAIRHGNVDLFDMLVEKGAKLQVPIGLCSYNHQKYLNALVTAAEYHNVEFICDLIKKGADINSYGILTSLPTDPRDRESSDNCSRLGVQLCLYNCATPLTAYLRLRTAGHLKSVLWLLDHGANPNNPVDFFDVSANHMSPLAALVHSPVFKSNDCDFELLVAQGLFEAGANPFDALAILCPRPFGMGECDALRLLLWKVLCQSTLETGPSIAGTAALIQGIKVNDSVLVKGLLDRGVLIPTDDHQFYPHPLAVALSMAPRGHFQAGNKTARSPDVVQPLLEAGCVPNGLIRAYDGLDMSPICRAVPFSKTDILKLLLDAGVRLSPAEYTHCGCPFQYAVCGHEPLESVKVLFAYGYKPVESPMSRDKLFGACIFFKKIVFQNALQTAALCGLNSVIELMVSKGVDLNAPGNEKEGATALQFALMEQYLHIAQLLIVNGAEVKAPSSSYYGTTCLQAAAAAGSLDCVKILIKRGADVNAEPHPKKAHSGTALQNAVRSGSLEIARYLVDHGADINAPPAPIRGATALQFASLHGFLAIAKFLIRRGADVMAMPAEKDGRTALEGAAENGRIDTVQLLLNNGAGLISEQREQVELASNKAGGLGYFAIRDLIRARLDEI